MENERITILLERQKEQILAEDRTEIQKHELQAESDKRSIQESTGIIESQRREIDHTLAGDEQLRRDHLLLQEQLLDVREAHIKRLHEMEELSSVQESRSMNLREEDWSKIKTQSLNLRPEFRKLQNEVNCMHDSRVFKDAESVRSELSHVPNQPVLFPLFRDPGGMLSRSEGMRSRNDKPPDTWDSHGISGNVFVNPQAFSSSPCPGGIQSLDF